MLRLRRASRTLAICSCDEVAALPRDADLTVVLTSRLARYALLPWSAELKTEEEWLAFGRHAFASTYGATAASWAIRVGPAVRGRARIACAIDGVLLEALRANPRVVSVQPSLMAEFNSRRRELERGSTWLILEESGRLLLALIAEGAWRLVRCRQANGDWRERLPELLAREHAASGEPACERVLVCPQGG